MAVAAFLLTLLVYLEFSQKHTAIKGHNLLNLSLLLLLIYFSAYLIIKNGGSVFFIPFCVIPMLSVTLFEELRVSLLLTLAVAFSIASLGGGDFYLALLFLTSGIVSIMLILGARKRSVIIRTGVVVGLFQAFMLIFSENFRIIQPDRYIILIINGIVCGIIVIGVLPVFEYLFKVVTNISLLELADFNHPLLERLTQEASGTYHHSLVVGNLSDAAARAVGVNALLARIGAYYHDIGKLSKPHYFSENQKLDFDTNKHEDLTPTMSRLIIMNHVKEGVEIAKKYKLNPTLIDFIQQHHGNSLVYYFYHRALVSSEESEEVKQEGFRYPGPKPKTKETAIVLLADSVEAATRTLKDANIIRIEEIVHKVINNKFIDGQLDECDLTLKELEKIAAVFIKLLSAMYHTRITYPDNANSEAKS